MMKWLKPNRPLIAEYCRGMVTVSDSVEYHEKYGLRLINMGVQIYGCPSNLVYTLDEALAWANQQLHTTSTQV